MYLSCSRIPECSQTSHPVHFIQTVEEEEDASGRSAPSQFGNQTDVSAAAFVINEHVLIDSDLVKQSLM